MGRVEIFLSYCWADEEIASDIEMHLAKDPEINLHRDKLDIRKWGSIKSVYAVNSQNGLYDIVDFRCLFKIRKLYV